MNKINNVNKMNNMNKTRPNMHTWPHSIGTDNIGGSVKII